MPFDREFALLFLEFVCAAGRDPKLRRRLATRLHELRSHTTARVGDPQLATAIGAASNGASIEALIFGEPEGAATFDLILGSLLTSGVLPPTRATPAAEHVDPLRSMRSPHSAVRARST